MKKLIFCAALFLSLLAGAQKPTYPVYKELKDKDLEGILSVQQDKKGLYGFANAKEKFVIKPKFDEAENFVVVSSKKEGTVFLAKVRSGEKWGVLKRNALYLFPPQFDAIDDFTTYGTAFVKLGVGYGMISSDGDLLLNSLSAYEKMKNSWTLYKIRERSNEGLYDVKKRAYIIPPTASSIQLLDHVAIYEKDGKTGIMDTEGNEVIPCNYDKVTLESPYIYTEKDGKYGVISEEGKIIYDCILPKRPDFIAREYEGMLIDGKPAILRRDGTLLTAREYDEQIFAANPAVYSADSLLPHFLKKHLYETLSPVEAKNLWFADHSFTPAPDYSLVKKTLTGDLNYMRQAVQPVLIKDVPAISVAGLPCYLGIPSLEGVKGIYPHAAYFVLAGTDGLPPTRMFYLEEAHSSDFLGAEIVDVLNDVPILKYAFCTWEGIPMAFVAYNNFSEENPSENRWYEVSNEEDMALLGITVSAPGEDGIAVYQVGSRYGYIGLTSDFFTQPVFDEANDISRGSAQVLFGGRRQTLSMNILKNFQSGAVPDGALLGFTLMEDFSWAYGEWAVTSQNLPGGAVSYKLIIAEDGIARITPAATPEEADKVDTFTYKFEASDLEGYRLKVNIEGFTSIYVSENNALLLDYTGAWDITESNVNPLQELVRK